MDLRNIVNKIVPDPGQVNPERVRSPDESELEFFEERERRKQIKERVREFRDKETDNLLVGNGLLSLKGNMLNTPNIISGDPADAILGADRHGNILNAKSIL